jgi:sucrose-6-phosphate hydrolase SacC (GH32 family)
MHVLRHGNRILAYTSGWSRRVSVSVETSIGLAVSQDGGLTFRRVGDGPVLTSSLHEPCLVGDPFVIVHDGVWHMWYIYGTRWVQGAAAGGERERVYKVGHATSTDGIDWRKEGVQLIDDRLNADECQALPTVIEHGGRHHMYFCYRQATDFRRNRLRGYRLGYAYSDDLRSWTRDDARAGIQPSETGWDADMMCYPHVFRCEGTIYLLYNGNEFGRAGFGLAVLEDG